MAIDLRAIVAAVKINTDLERVGDLAVNIAEAVRRYLQHPPVKKLIDIPRMAEIAQRMLRDSLDAFVRRDVDLAQHVLDQDDELDALKTQVFRELLTLHAAGPGDDRAVARSDPHLAAPRAHRRPCHEHRRGRHLHGLGARRPAPSARVPSDSPTGPIGSRHDSDALGADRATTPGFPVEWRSRARPAALCILSPESGRPTVASVLQRALPAAGSWSVAGRRLPHPGRGGPCRACALRTQTTSDGADCRGVIAGRARDVAAPTDANRDRNRIHRDPPLAVPWPTR